MTEQEDIWGSSLRRQYTGSEVTRTLLLSWDQKVNRRDQGSSGSFLEITIMPKCIVSGCPNHTARKDKNISNGIMLHGFPKDLLRIKCWLSQINQNFGDIESFARKILEGKKTNSFRICSEHFSPDSYRQTKRKTVLKDDAVPRYFHKRPPSSREQSERGNTISHAQPIKLEASEPPRVVRKDVRARSDNTMDARNKAKPFYGLQHRDIQGSPRARQFSSEPPPLFKMTSMDNSSILKTDRMLSLTLEILFLLTGEDYTVVKNRLTSSSSPTESGRRSAASETDPITTADFVSHEKNKKILQLTNQIIHLLTGEVPARCEDVAVYFSIEEWDYVDKHKHLYKNVILDDHQQNLYKNIILDDHQQNLHKNIIRDDHRQNLYKNIIRDDHRQNLHKNVILDDHQQNLYKKVMMDDHRQNLSKNVIIDNHKQNLHKKVMMDDHRQNLYKKVMMDDHQQNLHKNVIRDDHRQNLYKNVIIDDHRQNLHKNVILDDHRQNLHKNVILDNHRQKLYKKVMIDDHRQKLYKKFIMDHHQRSSQGEQPVLTPKPQKREDLIEEPLNDLNITATTGGDYISIDLTKDEPMSIDSTDSDDRTAQEPWSSECGDEQVSSPEHEIEIEIEDDLIEEPLNYFYATTINSPPTGGDYLSPELRNPDPVSADGMHRDDSAAQKPLSCSECGKCFRYPSRLFEHERVHTGEKPFSCPECGKCFIWKSLLVQHQKIHTGEHQCRFCRKCFTNQAKLMDHQRTHTGERPFACHLCRKSFGLKTSLTKHQRLHMSEKLLSCSECGKCFMQKSNLYRHQRTHMRQQPL